MSISGIDPDSRNGSGLSLAEAHEKTLALYVEERDGVTEERVLEVFGAPDLRLRDEHGLPVWSYVWRDRNISEGFSVTFSGPGGRVVDGPRWIVLVEEVYDPDDDR